MWLFKSISPKVRQEKAEMPNPIGTPGLALPMSQGDDSKTTISKPQWPSLKAKSVDEFLKLEIALWANIIKTILQMVIGLVVLFSVLLHLFHSVNSLWGFSIFQALYDAEILAIIGYALLYASAIELAYTLFTPGPDEAVDPLITGLAAVILLGIAKIDYEKSPLLNDEIVRNVAIFVVILVVFFVIRKYLLKEKQQ